MVFGEFNPCTAQEVVLINGIGVIKEVEEL